MRVSHFFVSPCSALTELKQPCAAAACKNQTCTDTDSMVLPAKKQRRRCKQQQEINHSAADAYSQSLMSNLPIPDQCTRKCAYQQQAQNPISDAFPRQVSFVHQPCQDQAQCCCEAHAGSGTYCQCSWNLRSPLHSGSCFHLPPPLPYQSIAGQQKKNPGQVFRLSGGGVQKVRLQYLHWRPCAAPGLR